MSKQAQSTEMENLPPVVISNMSHPERNALDEACEQAGMSRSMYIRKVLARQLGVTEEMREAMRVRRVKRLAAVQAGSDRRWGKTGRKRG